MRFHCRRAYAGLLCKHTPFASCAASSIYPPFLLGGTCHCSTSPAAARELLVGNTDIGIRSANEYSYQRQEFIGKLFPLIRPRTDAGEVLALVDITAGRLACYYVNGFKSGSVMKPVGDVSMATVSFNSFVFTKPVYEGDLISVDARVINAGNSSLGIYVSVKRQAYDCPTPTKVGGCFVTMATIDAKILGKPVSGVIPAVRLTIPEDIVHHENYFHVREETAIDRKTKDEAKRKTLTVAEVELPQNITKVTKVTSLCTEVAEEHHFGIQYLNGNNVIFGGEILRFMERTALHCGRVFAERSRLFTLAMLGMTFDSPIGLKDLARCTARVVCVRRSTLLVKVKVGADEKLQDPSKMRGTNSAYFVLAAVDPNGFPMEIPKGIDLCGATQEQLHSYWNARYMMETAEKRRYSH